MLPQLPGDAGLIAGQAIQQSGELGPVGVQTDSEETEFHGECKWIRMRPRIVKGHLAHTLTSQMLAQVNGVLGRPVTVTRR